MTSDPESRLFDFAASNRIATNEEEEIVTELHAALGTSNVPLRLRRPPIIAPKPNWHRYMYAAVTVALIVAVAAAGIFAIREQTASPQPTEIPEVVLGLASPDSEEAVSDATTCAPGASIPIIQGVSESPVDGVALLHTSSGDPLLDCHGDQELLASGIDAVTPWPWPGVISMWDGETLTYLNIFTRDSYVTEDQSRLNTLRPLGVITSRSTNQLIIVPESGSPTSAAILDLATMEAEALRDHQGNPISLDKIPAATSNYQGDCMVLAYSIHNSRLNSDYLGGFVVFDANGTTQTVNSLDLQMPVPREVATSPNCDQIASVSYQGQQMEGTTTLTIQDVSGNSSVSIPFDTPDRLTNLLWSKDGNSIVFSAGEDLMLLEAPFDSSDPVTLHDGIMTDDISLTRDPDIVTAIGMSYGGGPESVPHRTLIIDTSSHEVTELEGNFILRQRRLQPQVHNVLLVQEEQGQVYDATTGEHLGHFDGDVEMTQSFIYVPRENLGSTQPVIIGSSVDDMWRVLDSGGNPVMERIEPPADGDLQGHPMISMSRDGWIFISQGWDSSTGWLRHLDDPEADWMEITFKSDINTVQFLNTEGLSIPQSATPQASPIASDACDLSGDTPIVVGAETAQFSGTNVIITPTGEMKLVCGETQTTLATGVDFAFPMNAPNVLLAETDSGALLMNIESGESIQLPSSAMQILQNQHLVAPWGSWLVAPSSDDQMVGSLYDLRTLNEIPLIYDANPDHRVVLDSVAGISVNTTDSHVAVTVSFQHSSSSRYLQGFFVADADGNSRFIHTERDVLPRSIALSPDGNTIATTWYQGTMEFGQTNISLYDASEGHLEESWDMQTGDIPIELTWLHDGSGLVLTDGTALYRLDAEHPGDGLRVLFEGPEVGSILLTPDPKVVAATITEQQQQGPPSSQTVIVNIDTGETILLDGRDLWASSFGPAPTRTVLVLHDFFAGQADASIKFTVVDSVTGEVISEIEHNPPGQASINNALSQRDQGDVDIFSLTAESTWQLLDVDGQPNLQQVSPPEDRGSEDSSDLFVSRSGDGTIVMTFFDPFEVWVLEPGEDEWMKLDVAPPDNDLGLPVVVMFIPGSD